MRVVQCATRKERAIGGGKRRKEEERVSGRIMLCNCGVHTAHREWIPCMYRVCYASNHHWFCWDNARLAWRAFCSCSKPRNILSSNSILIGCSIPTEAACALNWKPEMLFSPCKPFWNLARKKINILAIDQIEVAHLIGLQVKWACALHAAPQIQDPRSITRSPDGTMPKPNNLRRGYLIQQWPTNIVGVVRIIIL